MTMMGEASLPSGAAVRAVLPSRSRYCCARCAHPRVGAGSGGVDFLPGIVFPFPGLDSSRGQDFLDVRFGDLAHFARLQVLQRSSDYCETTLVVLVHVPGAAGDECSDSSSAFVVSAVESGTLVDQGGARAIPVLSPSRRSATRP